MFKAVCVNASKVCTLSHKPVAGNSGTMRPGTMTGWIAAATLFCCFFITVQSQECQINGDEDIVFVLDNSRSRRQDFPQIKNFITEFITNLDIGLEDNLVGIITYGVTRSSDIEFTLSDYTSESALISAIDNVAVISTRGGPNLVSGLRVLLNSDNVIGLRNGRPHIAIIFVHDKANNPTTAMNVVRQIHEAGTYQVYAVGLGDADGTELNFIATNPSLVFFANNLQQLRDYFSQQICQDPCSQPVDPGSCECFVPNYFWNSTSEICEMFSYSGCGGNMNRFPDLISCANMCACPSANCPDGTQCKTDQLSGRSICEPSCEIDNGGCDDENICVLSNVTCVTTPCLPVVQCLDCEVGGIDLIFVVDGSSSIGSVRFQLLRDFVRDISAALDIGLQRSLVGVILFSDRALLHFDLLEYTDQSNLLSAIDPGIPYLRGRTNTADALILLLSSARDGRMGLRNGRPRFAIVITDGESSDPAGTKTAAVELHKADIFDRVYAVGIGRASITELNRIASNPSSVLFTNAFDAAVIQMLQHNLTQQLCENQTCPITDCPKGSQCKVHPPTGEPFCEPSCEIDNGGCPDDEICSLRSVTCVIDPCPPVVECSSCTLGGIDVVFVLDVSISIKSQRFQLIRDFVSQISRRLDVGPDNTLVGVILFGDDARIHFDLLDNTDQTELLSSIAALPYLRLRGTNTHTALELLLESARDGRLGLRDGHPHVAIVVTDGRSTNEEATVDAAEALHNASIYQIYAAGVGNRVDVTELETIASDPSLSFIVDNFDLAAIEELEERISEQLCANFSCNITDCPKGSQCEVYEPTGEPFCVPSCEIDNGGCADNQICSLMNTTCAQDEPCPPVVECSNCTLRGIDVVFVLDVSISIKSQRFQLIRDFVSQISRRLDVGPDNTLVGVILFGDDARIHFDLLDNTDQTELLSSIAAIPYLRLRGTNTHTALELLLEGARDGRLGLRDGHPHVAIVVTDGRSTNEEATVDAAEALHNASIYQIYAAGVGNRVDVTELETIASDPSLSFIVDNFDLAAIEELEERISEQLCASLSCNITDCPKGSQCEVHEPTGEPFCVPSCEIDNGGCADNQICSLMNTTCAQDEPCPPVVECSNCTLGEIDVVFVLDVSISIKSQRFQLIRDFVSQISRRLDVGPDNTLAGVILFGDDARIHFDLLDNTDQTELLSSIAAIPYLRLRGTNTHTALELLLEGARDGRLGLRDGRPHVAIVVTDGRSTKPEDLKTAARALHAENIYQVYAAGVGDRVDVSELELIASNPSLALTTDTFDASALAELEESISQQLCQNQSCSITDCPKGSQCKIHPPTGDPFCEPSCAIDNGGCGEEEICSLRNGACGQDEPCPPIVECSACPPTCSHEFCSKEENTKEKCSRPPPHSNPGCPDRCHTTHCRACYYSPQPRRTFKVCDGCALPINNRCLRSWTKCVSIRDERKNPCTGDCRTAENFKCYDFPACIIEN